MAHKRCKERDRQRWGGRGRERLSHCTVATQKKGHPYVSPFVCLGLLFRGTVSLDTACDSWVVLHTGSHWAGKYPSSKITLSTPPKHSFNDWTTQRCPICVRHAVSKALVHFMQNKTTHIGFECRSRTAHFALSFLQMVNSRERRLKGLLGAPLRKISFYWVKTED